MKAGFSNIRLFVFEGTLSDLNNLRYNLNKLYADIHCGTQINTLRSKELTQYGLKREAKTLLEGKIVTTAWVLEKNFTIRFITLIPGGDKKWKN